MATKTEHTPTPYVASMTGIGDERGDMLINADLGDHRIESIGRLWNTHGRAKANAAFIVRAVNAHTALLDACKAIEPYLPTDSEILDYAATHNGETSGRGVAARLIRAAVALAGTKEGEKHETQHRTAQDVPAKPAPDIRAGPGAGRETTRGQHPGLG
jgi:hypothetical protein